MSDRTKWIIGIILGIWLVGVIARTIIASVAMKNGYLPKKKESNPMGSNLMQHANDQVAAYNDQGRNAAITRLYNAAKVNTDAFRAMNLQEAQVFIKGGSKSDIDDCADIIIKGEPNFTSVESARFSSLWAKITGTQVSSDPRMVWSKPILTYQDGKGYLVYR